MPLTSTGESGLYEFRTGNVYFFMKRGSQRVRCAVTLEALETLELNLQRGEATRLVARATGPRASTGATSGALALSGRPTRPWVGGARSRLKRTSNHP
jgi:hypothetical protein